MNRGDIPRQIQAAGVAGAGGAGFPSHVKWSTLDDVDYLLVNHQESEPNFYADKWLGKEHAEDLAAFAAAVTDKLFDCVVVGTKEKYRDEWLTPLENAVDATFYEPDSLPLGAEGESGTAIAATPDVYTYSEESVLLMVTAGVSIGDDLPTDHGWLVHNTETLYNIFRALSEGTPVTRKYVHVGGETPRHRCLEVPIGTPATTLLESAGIDSGEVGSGQVLADGGPGWCYRVESPAKEFGIRKRTNGILVLDEELATEHTEDDGQIDVLTAGDWTDRPHETEPSSLVPDEVRIPLITNAAYEGLVAPSEPVVKAGDKVAEGDVIAAPAGEEVSNTQHASIDGIITDVTDTHVIIKRA
jgi:Na+-translocating ferredoxin:NAD+ oxidoreductase RnfC subunit